MFGTKRLQSKLIIAFLLVALIPTGIIAFYSIRSASDTLIAKITAEELQSVSSEAVALQAHLLTISNDALFLSEASTTRSYLQVMASESNAYPALSDAEISFFQSFLKRSPQYEAISVLNVGGREAIHVVNDPTSGVATVIPPDSRTQAGAAYFQQAIALPASQIYISPFDLNTTNGQIDKPPVAYISFSVPLHADNGSIQGVLVLRALLSSIVQDNFFHAQNAQSYLVDNDGSYLFNSDASKLYNRVLKSGISFNNDQPHDLPVLYGSDQGSILASKDRPDSLQVFAHITLTGQTDVRWLLLRETALNSILTEVNQAQLVIGGLALFALLIAVIVALLLSNNIVRPVRQLVQVADAVSKGNLNTAMPPLKTRDEIAQLATAFERMLGELRTLYNDLENRVKVRTAELETTNKQLVIAEQNAEQSSNAKSVFLSNMSHELRTPLNVIIGYSSSILNMPMMFDNVELPPVYQSYIRLIETSGHYLLGLINDILDLSKIEAGNFDLRFSCVDLKEIFTGVVSTSVGLLKEKAVQIQTDYPDNLPQVWADPIRVRQIILNLMSNAIKFTEQGRVILVARVEGQSVQISVSDSGIGIPENALAKIFDRFKQVEHDSSKNYGGTGLGLDISKQLSLLHHSDLTVQSTLGKGSTFTFSLPLATPEQMGSGVSPEQSGGATTIYDPATILTEFGSLVLLVTDEAKTREALQPALEQAGYVVIDTNDGAQAIELASGTLPALVIMDTDLPTLDGWAVLTKLKAVPDTNQIPVILVTDANQQSRVKELGGWGVEQPVNPTEVIKVAQQLLHPVLIKDIEIKK